MATSGGGCRSMMGSEESAFVPVVRGELGLDEVGDALGVLGALAQLGVARRHPLVGREGSAGRDRRLGKFRKGLQGEARVKTVRHVSQSSFHAGHRAALSGGGAIAMLPSISAREGSARSAVRKVLRSRKPW